SPFTNSSKSVSRSPPQVGYIYSLAIPTLQSALSAELPLWIRKARAIGETLAYSANRHGTNLI
ncbi:hypothetical protein PILCRDRAFT_815284, partial [Piloderma croceum F 1598]